MRASRLLDNLAAEAAIVVAEDMPVPRERDAKQRLHDNTEVPIWLVDTSYGGLLWCLGQFDRPFLPEKPIFGLVRDRPSAVHAKRLDVEKYLLLIGS